MTDELFSKPMTLQDLHDYFETPEGKREKLASESSYRKGYFDAINRIIKALEADTQLKDIERYFYGPLWDWRFGDCTIIVFPPDLKASRKRKSKT